MRIDSDARARGDRRRPREVELAAHPKPGRLLGALAIDHLRGGGLGYAELSEAAWPPERITEEARRNRFDVSLSRLRGLGLRDLIVLEQARYRLTDGAWWIVTGAHEDLVRRLDRRAGHDELTRS